MSQSGKIRIALSPQAERYARHDAPVEVRRMAARGALPLAPAELATVLFVLAHDPDEEVKTQAAESLAGLPDPVMTTVLEGKTQAPVLSYLAHLIKDNAEHCERLALNPRADDTTIAFLATLPHRRTVDAIATNQERILRHPAIVDALGSNPLTGRATIDRILSFLGLDPPAGETPEEERSSVPLTAAEFSDAEAEAALRTILGDDVSGFAEELIEDTDEDATPDAATTLYALVQSLSVFQKIKLARMGNKEARGLLVRDRNKIVATAAIRSPKITENEVVGIARARNVCDEVLRAIAANRDWTRTYQVKLGLATNPKTPQPVALKFLNYLQERDLRGIMKSKDVPSAISLHARRIMSKKGKL